MKYKGAFSDSEHHQHMTDASGMESSGNSSQDSSKNSGMSYRPQLQHRHLHLQAQQGRNSPDILWLVSGELTKWGTSGVLIQNHMFLFSCLQAVGSEQPTSEELSLNFSSSAYHRGNPCCSSHLQWIAEKYPQTHRGF